MARHTTNLTGVIYRDSITNGKADKTYYIRYKDENNMTVELKIGKYSEGVREAYCNAKRNEILTKQRIGEEPPIIAQRKKREILSIQTLADEYFSHRAEKETKINDEFSYKAHILPFFKFYDLNRISKNDILKFTNHLKEKQNLNTKKPIAPKTINNILNLLKAIIKYSLKNDLIRNDFTKYINLLDIDNARERFLSKEEIEILYDKKKKDMNFTHKIITIKDFKNNSTYKAFLTKDLKELLISKIQNIALNDKIFKSNPGKRLRTILDDLFNMEIYKDDRKNKVVIHTLRHTFASHLAINGTPIFTIQKLMNHKDIKMTLRYAKLSPDSGREAVEALKI